MGHRRPPAGSLFALALSGVASSTLVVLGHIGFWTHSTLVLIFLNILPYSKHFHIITAIPNVFPRGHLAARTATPARAQHRGVDGGGRESDRG